MPSKGLVTFSPYWGASGTLLPVFGCLVGRVSSSSSLSLEDESGL